MGQVQAYSPEEIRTKREQIHQQMLSVVEANFTSLKKSTIQKLFDLYDDVFFGGQILEKVTQDKATLTMSVTTRKNIKFGGMCKRLKKGTRCFYTLHFPATVYISLFNKGEKNLMSGGLTCGDRLDCLQLTFEHELIHLIMFLWKYEGKGVYSAHGKLFQCMLNSYFGQTEFRHSLFAGDVSSHLTRADIYVGMKVKVKDAGLGVVKGFTSKKIKVDFLKGGKLVSGNLSIQLLERTDEKFDLPTHLERSSARVGMKVKFDIKKKEVTGTLIKINPSRGVVTMLFEGKNRKINIPWVMLRKA